MEEDPNADQPEPSAPFECLKNRIKATYNWCKPKLPSLWKDAQKIILTELLRRVIDLVAMLNKIL